MPEDEIAHQEVAALSRRYEQHAEQANDALKVIKSDVLHLRLEVGTLSARLDSLESSVDEVRGAITDLRDEQRAANARVIELLSSLVGRDPQQ
jgi:predicted  nucleic acid-binding Zn-ribbon protein